MTRTLWIGLAVLALVACGPASNRSRGGGGGGGGTPGGQGEGELEGEGEGEVEEDDGPPCPAPQNDVPRGTRLGQVLPAAPFKDADDKLVHLYDRWCGNRVIVVMSAAPW